jgi:cytochrome b pre-mRNA-processing protein 3
MVFQLFRRNGRAGTIRALYGAIVAQARRPAFYRVYGVPDTVDGRFDMIVLHVALFFRRVRAEEQVSTLGQLVFDAFCRDMDHNLREMGVSDVRIPHRMRELGAAYYGRAASYDRALAADDHQVLVGALAKNIFASDGAPAGAHHLAAYVREAVRDLDRQPSTGLAAAVLDFPDPDTILVAGNGT